MLKQTKRPRCLSLLAILAANAITFISCSREYSSEALSTGNKPPVAKAGADKTISLPIDSVLLDGSSSYDQDGKITTWQWTAISGPSSFRFEHSDSAKSTVTSLTQAIYQFELKVTDDKGASSRDTVQVTVHAATVTKHLPVAKAGPDQTITSPANTITLDGTSSYDSSGTPLNFLWKQFSGPTSVITNINFSSSTVLLSDPGNYDFELKVWNANGQSFDTVRVTLLAVNNSCNITRTTLVAQMKLIGTLPEPFDWEAPTIYAAGNKLIIPKHWEFQSGNNPICIYDLQTMTWETKYLPSPRTDFAVIAEGNKVFFAGGADPSHQNSKCADVYIYDAVSDSFSRATLSEPRSNCKAAAVGNKVLFAGGFMAGDVPSNVVDIYDLQTRLWTTHLIGTARELAAAVTVQDEVYFCGGFTLHEIKTLYYNTGQPAGDFNVPLNATSQIDIYNSSTGTWSQQAMAIPKIYFSAVSANDRIYFAGGIDMSAGYPNIINNQADNLTDVEVKQINSTATTHYCLLKGKRYYDNNAVFVNGMVIFFSGLFDESGKFDIFDTRTQTWSIGLLPSPSFTNQATIVALQNKLYVVATVDGQTKLFELIL